MRIMSLAGMVSAANQRSGLSVRGSEKWREAWPRGPASR